MHACARALHDAVNAIFRLGATVSLLVLLQKNKKKKQKKTKKKYCTVDIPTEMEFTGTFQKYLQCVNRM